MQNSNSTLTFIEMNPKVHYPRYGISMVHFLDIELQHGNSKAPRKYNGNNCRKNK